MSDDIPHSASRTVSPAHSGTISVFLRIMMTIFIRNLRIIRTYRLILKPNMFPRLKVRFLRRTWDF